MSKGLETTEGSLNIARIGIENSLKSFNVVIDTPELEAWIENNIRFIASHLTRVSFLEEIVHRQPAKIAELERRIAELEAQLNEKENP